MESLTVPVKVFALAAKAEEAARPEITTRFNRRNPTFRTGAFIADLLVGWHPSDAGGTASGLEDDPTDEKLQVLITQRKKKCGERGRASRPKRPDCVGGGPGQSLLLQNLSLTIRDETRHIRNAERACAPSLADFTNTLEAASSSSASEKRAQDKQTRGVPKQTVRNCSKKRTSTSTES
jgi:hypothetical protein